MSRVVVSAVVVLAVAGHAAAAVQSGLTGTLFRSPTTPVCRVGTPCSRPAPGVTIRFVRTDGTTVRVTTGSRGAFRAVLRPGRYAVRIGTRDGLGSRVTPSAVTIVSGRFTRQDIVLDTGIR